MVRMGGRAGGRRRGGEREGGREGRRDGGGGPRALEHTIPQPLLIDQTIVMTSAFAPLDLYQPGRSKSRDLPCSICSDVRNGWLVGRQTGMG